MKLPFKKKKTNSEVAVSAVAQTYTADKFASEKASGLDSAFYIALRDSLPVLDAAIKKTVRLTGGFCVECRNKSDEEKLALFLNDVNTGAGQGIDSFLNVYLDELLTCGTALGEMIMDGDFGGFSLYNAELKNISVKRSEKNPVEKLICVTDGITEKPVKNQSAILYSVLNPEPGQLTGNSLLKGLPFVTSTLLQIFETIGTNWERMGNLRYAVTYKPQNDALDKAYAKERAAQIAKGWSEAMKSGGRVKDFVAVGDVEIKVIGADNQILDSEVPVRQLLEQIVAKTGLPPFMLGLNWSTTERMAKQQTDLLTSELWNYRRILTPVIMKICKTYLRMNGLSDDCTVVWDDISLMDKVEEAKAKYYIAQAKKTEREQENEGN